MMDRVEILASRIRRTLSRNRWLSAHIHGPVPDSAGDEPGLVLIQVDGLGHGAFRDALRRGHMPFVAHLIEDEQYVARDLYSGLPSSTPGVQAELLYGVRTAVPAFAYYDREEDRVMRLAEASAAQTLEAQCEARDRGLLHGGAAWSDIFTGGAAFPHLCATTTGLRFALRVMAPARVAALVLWHGWSILRILGNLVIETGLAVWDVVRGTMAGAELLQELRFVPLRVAVTAGMREIVTAGAAADTERGLPIIHLNYLGYDEHAHRRGPDSRFARWTLRGIDRSIRRVWLAAHRSRRRDYHVWIYSDHGQEATLPYPTRTGEKIGDAVTRAYRELREMPVLEPSRRRIAREPIGTRRSEWLGPRATEWMRPGRSLPAAHPVGAVDTLADARERGDRDAREDPIVVAEGPVGFVYLQTDVDVADRDRLAHHVATSARIPIVMAPDAMGGAHVWLASGRRLSLPVQAAEVFGPDHPYLEDVTEDMLRVVHHENAGTLTLLGWNRGRPESLQFEHGAHGGPGPRETSAFVLLPSEIGALVADRAVIRPLDLRDLARGLLERSPDAAARGAAAVRTRASGDAGPDAGEPVRLRIVTYNVHGCRGMDGKYSPLRIARVITRLQPDIVCLQELDQVRTRSGGIDQVEEIARRLRADYEFHAVAEVDDGRFGNAVLTAHPMQLVVSGPLPRISSRLALEDRGAIWVRVTVQGQDIHVINTHLSVHRRERHLQCDALVGDDWLGHPGLDGPTVLVGDFNASPNSPTARRLARRLRNVEDHREGEAVLATWSGRLPLRRIDHVYVSREFSVHAVHAPQTRLSRVASDHLPLVADLSCRRVARASDSDERFGADRTGADPAVHRSGGAP